MTPENVRAFVALEIPPPTRAAIAEIVSSLKPRLPGLSWLKPETIHLTLRFLGPTTPSQIEVLQPALAAAAARCAASEIRIARVGTFPGGRNPRVLWLGTELPEPLVVLQRACEEAAVSAGLPPEERPFRSHITLGRWRDRARGPLPELPDVDLGRVVLESLVLYKSQLHPKGAIHTPIASWPLGARP